MELTKKEWEHLLNSVRAYLDEVETDFDRGKYPSEEDALKKEISELKVLEKKILKNIIKNTPKDNSCDHNWKEWEDEYCNVRFRCSKCKKVYNKFEELGD